MRREVGVIIINFIGHRKKVTITNKVLQCSIIDQVTEFNTDRKSVV